MEGSFGHKAIIPLGETESRAEPVATAAIQHVLTERGLSTGCWHCGAVTHKETSFAIGYWMGRRAKLPWHLITMVTK